MITVRDRDDEKKDREWWVANGEWITNPSPFATHHSPLACLLSLAGPVI